LAIGLVGWVALGLSVLYIETRKGPLDNAQQNEM
jgi:hypothetical protein